MNDLHDEEISELNGDLTFTCARPQSADFYWPSVRGLKHLQTAQGAVY